MARAKGSLIPMRGSVEDWGPGKHQRNLERKDAYAQRMWKQVVEGPPDFEKLLATGAAPPEKVPSPRKPAPAGKTAKPPAQKNKKKPKRQP